MNYQEIVLAYNDSYDDPKKYEIVETAWNEVKAKYPALFDGKDIGTETGPGWWPALIECFDGIMLVLAKYPGTVCSIRQIKEKFGTLRMYLRIHGGSLGEDEDGEEQFADAADGARHEINDLVQQADNKTSKTCEYCGEPGESRHDFSWIKTLCDRHHAERLSKRDDLMN